MTHGSLFSGIGGFDLAAEWAGISTIWQVEKDAKALAVLQKNFPNARRYDDVFNFDEHDERNRVDIISGGFPCQPFSVAGKRKGTGDDRHLWPRMLEIITGLQPSCVVAENVPGLLTIENGVVFESVCAGLEGAGYEVWPVIIPACAVGAWHRRDRVWIVANNASESSRRYSTGTKERQKQELGKGSCGDDVADSIGERQLQQYMRFGDEPKDNTFIGHGTNVSDAERDGLEKQRNGGIPERQAIHIADGCIWETESGLGGKINGLSCGMDRFGRFWGGDWEGETQRVCESTPGRVDRIRQLGNAIVPQVAYQIFMAILEAEAEK